MRGVAFIILIVFLFATIAYADTIYLKNGKRVEGKIIEKTDQYIKVDFIGVTLTYWMDEIEKVEINQTSRGENAETYFKRGSSYLKEGKWQEAIGEFKTALSLDKYHVGSHFNLGCTYALAGEYDKAIEEFNKALPLETAPFGAFCYFNIAGVYTKRALMEKRPDLFKQASENFRKTAEILPNFLLAVDYAMHTSINAQTVLDNIDKVMFSLDEVGMPPDSAIFLPVTKIEGSGEKKICIFDAEGPALLYFYRSPNCHWRVCESKLNPQSPENFSEESRRCMEAVLNLLKEEPDSHLNKLIKWNIFTLFMGFYLNQQDWDKVLEFAEKAKNVGLNYSNEYIFLALSYFKKGDYQMANASAKKALEINPETQQRDFLEEIIKQTERNL